MIAFDENDYLDMECEEYLGEVEVKDSLDKDKRRFQRRKTNVKKAIRKRKLAKEIYHSLPEDLWEWYNNLHQYSKNKIHCSCPICRTKRKDRARYGKYYSPSVNEQRRIDKMNYELWEEIE
jgi:hypothetical protein